MIGFSMFPFYMMTTVAMPEVTYPRPRVTAGTVYAMRESGEASESEDTRRIREEVRALMERAR